MKFTHYIVVRSELAETFEDRVTVGLKRGYVPYGNPFHHQLMYCQAMVLPEPPTTQPKTYVIDESEE